MTSTSWTALTRPSFPYPGNTALPFAKSIQGGTCCCESKIPKKRKRYFTNWLHSKERKQRAEKWCVGGTAGLRPTGTKQEKDCGAENWGEMRARINSKGRRLAQTLICSCAGDVDVSERRGRRSKRLSSGRSREERGGRKQGKPFCRYMADTWDWGTGGTRGSNGSWERIQWLVVWQTAQYCGKTANMKRQGDFSGIMGLGKDRFLLDLKFISTFLAYVVNTYILFILYSNSIMHI